MFGKYNNAIIFLVICIIMIAILYDTLLIKLYRFIYGLVFSEANIEESTKQNIATFTIIAVIYGVGQYFVLRYLSYKNKEIKITQRLHINLIHQAVVILQFTLVALLGLIISQMVITSSYSVAILFAAVGISYTLAIVMMGILADRFFSWFRANRNIVVLAYGLASAMIAINAAFTLAYVGDLLTNQPPYIGPHILHISSTPSTNSILNLGFVISSIVSFLMTWIATIASAEVEKQIVNNVLSTIKANQEEMKYEIGIETSLDEKDMVNYLEEVIEETKTKQRSN